MSIQKLKAELSKSQRLAEIARPPHLPPLLLKHDNIHNKMAVRINNSVVYGKRLTYSLTLTYIHIEDGFKKCFPLRFFQSQGCHVTFLAFLLRPRTELGTVGCQSASGNHLFTAAFTQLKSIFQDYIIKKANNNPLTDG